jgi:hypothetical protein
MVLLKAGFSKGGAIGVALMSDGDWLLRSEPGTAA